MWILSGESIFKHYVLKACLQLVCTVVWIWNRPDVLCKFRHFSHQKARIWVDHCTARHFRKEWRFLCLFLTVEDALDDIPGGPHKSFLKKYLKDWPYPHLTQYRAGQSINVELNGVQQRCEVQVVDCSLIQVVFQVSAICCCLNYSFPVIFV